MDRARKCREKEAFSLESDGMDVALGLLCAGQIEDAKAEALRVLASADRRRCGENTMAVFECWWRFGPWLDACQSKFMCLRLVFDGESC